MQKKIRIGCGSAYSEDNLKPAIDLAKRGKLNYLCFDSLAERTLAQAQMRKRTNPKIGYDLRLEELVKEFASFVGESDLKIIGNMGVANPVAAVDRAIEVCKENNIENVTFASITGDDISDCILELDPILLETGQPLSRLKGQVVSANAYTGSEAIVEALQKGANFIIGGRLADPSLYVAPLAYEYGWSLDNWDKIGKATLVGHLLECGTHATGGNFADPPYRSVSGLNNLGLPIAEVESTGNGILTKLSESGGEVTEDILKAQIIYEIHDPEKYLTPDVTCNVRNVQVEEIEKDTVRFWGATGRERPNKLKVLVGVLEGFIGEGEISFAGPGASKRAKLSRTILEDRIRQTYGEAIDELRIDIIGLDSIHGTATQLPKEDLHDVRLRIACRTNDKQVAEAVGKEAEWQFFGPSGGGGVRKSVREVLTMYSTFIDRNVFDYNINLKGV